MKNLKDLREWLSEKLKSKRESESLTMRDVGKSLGKPHSIVGKVEHQQRKLEVCEFIEYCQHINACPVTMFSELVEQHNNG